MFWIAAIMAIFALTAFCLVYTDAWKLTTFEVYSRIYIYSVIAYMVMRQVRKKMKPNVVKFKRGEFILLFWILVLVVFAIITFFMPEKADLLTLLGKQFGYLLGIFAGGKLIKRLPENWFFGN